MVSLTLGDRLNKDRTRVTWARETPTFRAQSALVLTSPLSNFPCRSWARMREFRFGPRIDLGLGRGGLGPGSLNLAQE